MSSGDFSEALAATLGKQASGLSATSGGWGRREGPRLATADGALGF